RTNQVALETRAHNRRCADLCSSRKGVAHTSLADIAKRAGLTRGAIYWHFENKAELFDALLLRARMPIQHLDEATRDADAEGPLGKLQVLLTELFRQNALDPTTRRTHDIASHHCDHADRPCHLRGHLRDRRRQSLIKLQGSLRNAIARGQLPERLDVPMAAACIQAQVIGILDTWLLRPEDYSLAERAEQLASGILDTLRY